MDGAKLFFDGFSELRRNVEAIDKGMQCNVTNASVSNMRLNQEICGNRRFAVTKVPRHADLKHTGNLNGPKVDAYCREEMYRLQQYDAICYRPQDPPFTLHFEWKSFAFSDRELEHRARVVEAARFHPFVLVVISVGAHQFTKMPGHTFEDFHAVDDDKKWDQRWIDEYVNETMTLFEVFNSKSLPENVCVVWRNSNVGKRNYWRAADGSLSTNLAKVKLHHPSVTNGIHHWMNRFTAPLARRAGIGIVDVSDITTVVEPRGYGKPSAKVSPASLEGDIYHGYPDGYLSDAIMQRACEACPRQCGAKPNCTLGLAAIEKQRKRQAEERERLRNATASTASTAPP